MYAGRVVLPWFYLGVFCIPEHFSCSQSSSKDFFNRLTDIRNLKAIVRAFFLILEVPLQIRDKDGSADIAIRY